MRIKHLLVLIAVAGSAALVSCTDSGRPGVSPEPRTIYVSPDGLGDYPTIQCAIDSAVSGDIIELADGTYSDSGNVDLDLKGKTLVIRSVSGNPDVCVLSCRGTEEDPHRGFLFQSGESSETRIEGITVADGYAAGSPGSIDQSGGGVHCRARASPTFANCVFRNCIAAHCGGAVTLAHNCRPTMVGCVFIDNSADWGGAICSVAECDPVITDCSFIGNTATYGGGGAHCQSSAPIVTRCRFVNNSAPKGAGMHCTESCSATIEFSTFHGNTADYAGGAIYCQSSTVAVVSSTLVENAAVSAGAGIFCQLTDSLTVTHSIIAFSTTGDALDCYGGEVHLDIGCSDFYGNADGDWVGCAAASKDLNDNITDDPLFVDRGAGDFRLLHGSPCGGDQTPCGLIGAWDSVE